MDSIKNYDLYRTEHPLVIEGLENYPPEAGFEIFSQILERGEEALADYQFESQGTQGILQELEELIDQHIDQQWENKEDQLQKYTTDFAAILVSCLQKDRPLHCILRSSHKLNDFSCFLPQHRIEFFPFRLMVYRLTNPEGFSLTGFYQEWERMLGSSLEST